MGSYIGWIPTVSRRLSFSLIGQTSHPTEAITSNISTRQARYIVSFQKRDLLDSSIPLTNFLKKKIVNLLFGISGEFWFVLIAKCTDEKYIASKPLQGEVLIFHERSNKLKTAQYSWQNIQDGLERSQGILNAYEDQCVATDLESYYSQNVEKLVSTLADYAVYSVQFNLQRNGIIEIHAPKDNEFSSHDEHMACSQVFFFLKDIIHRHQHHHPKTDTILDIYKLGDQTWACETLRALYKKVLTFKRDKAEGIYSSALGVLAYVKAFKKICTDDLGCQESELVTSRDDDALVQSIQAAQDDLRFISSQRHRISETIRSSLLSVLGLILTLASLANFISPAIKIQPENYFISFLADTAINNTIYLVMAVGWGISSYSYVRNWDYCLRRYPWIKDAVRILQGIKNQNLAGLTLILIAVLLGFATYKLALL